MSTASLLRFSPLPPVQIVSRRCAASTIGIPLRLAGPAALENRRHRRTSISMSYRSAVPASDRILAALSYSFPFFNALPYGRFLLLRFPTLGLAFDPLLPLIGAYRSVPFASFVAFFALYVGVVRNTAFGRFVRFNAMQAVVLDVLLAVPALLQRIFEVRARGFGFRVLEIGYDAVFLMAAGCCLYGVVSCVLGKTPYLPVVASAADRQL